MLEGRNILSLCAVPFPDIPLIPTGGVSLETAAAFIASGATALGVGGELISESELKAGNPGHITQTAKRFVAIVQEARKMGQPVTS